MCSHTVWWYGETRFAATPGPCSLYVVKQIQDLINKVWIRGYVTMTTSPRWLWKNQQIWDHHQQYYLADLLIHVRRTRPWCKWIIPPLLRVTRVSSILTATPWCLQTIHNMWIHHRRKSVSSWPNWNEFIYGACQQTWHYLAFTLTSNLLVSFTTEAYSAVELNADVNATYWSC